VHPEIEEKLVQIAIEEPAGSNKGFPTNSRYRESLFLQVVTDLYGLDIIWKHSKNA